MMLHSLLGFFALLLQVEGRRPEIITSNNNGNSLDNDKWLSTVSQYDKDRYWNKFRDDDYFKNWSPSKPFDQEMDIRSGRQGDTGPASRAASAKWRTEEALDATKDPCLKVKCPPHKVCVSHDYQTAICINHKQLMHSMKPRRGNLAHKYWMGTGNLAKCKPCPVIHPSPVCGLDGHTYSSKCKLEFQACSTGKTISLKCEGPCPCLPGQEVIKPRNDKNGPEKILAFRMSGACSDHELRSLASRLKDWFGALHQDANRDLKTTTASDAAQGRFDTSILPICKDSLGWMFNKLDMNYDLLLDHTELSAIYLDKYEQCMKPLFNSCDSFKDGKLSNNEWCYCFQKPDGLPCQNEINRIQNQSRRKPLVGAFIPRCNEEGYFKPTQCHGSTGQCWCVDKYGNEIAGSRKQGNPTCEEDQETSGDFGSGGAVILLDDQEDERDQASRQKERKVRVHPRGAIEDDEDEEDDKDDEIGYVW
ncbi:testican-1 isoform X2 [Lepisosteus oculatus]|uniref:testican-1 isoform X2 n=1 Tax=Lepisosteus oculatus TaxID=7918 RepID=UPI00074022EA|nr:PREDICTED: testican-1 isoform X2 [Lepisosteus oculatus]